MLIQTISNKDHGTIIWINFNHLTGVVHCSFVILLQSCQVFCWFPFSLLVNDSYSRKALRGHLGRIFPDQDNHIDAAWTNSLTRVVQRVFLVLTYISLFFNAWQAKLLAFSFSSVKEWSAAIPLLCSVFEVNYALVTIFHPLIPIFFRVFAKEKYDHCTFGTSSLLSINTTPAIPAALASPYPQHNHQSTDQCSL